jgi:UDP-N-acetylmuramate: L-alanyl-gamma-D-glutamyl-meso-diaminopimelate ligase
LADLKELYFQNPAYKKVYDLMTTGPRYISSDVEAEFQALSKVKEEFSKLVLPKDAWIHFIRIGGTAMGNLATLLKSQGYQVTGSDDKLYPPMNLILKEEKIHYVESRDSRNLSKSNWPHLKLEASREHPHVLILGNAVGQEHPEFFEAVKLVQENKSTLLSLPEAMNKFFIHGRSSFVVTGTHGKTSTTSLLAYALKSLDKNTGYLIGGKPKDFETGSDYGSRSGPVVLEGDEYNTAITHRNHSKFLYYDPHWIIVNALEMDHADIFRNEEDILNQFRLLVRITTKGIILLDDESSPRPAMMKVLAQEASARGLKVIRFGFNENSDFRIKKNSISCEWKTRLGEKRLGVELHLNVKINNQIRKDYILKSPMIGEHQKLNVVAVIATLYASGYLSEIQDNQKWLSEFSGIRRRMEILAVNEKHLLIEDFAHHPTAYEFTLKSAKESFPDRKLCAFMEFHSATAASNAFYNDLLKLLPIADAVFLKKVNRQRSSISLTSENLDVDKLAKELSGRCEVYTATTAAELVELYGQWLSKNHNPKALELVMSNGAFEDIYSLLKAKLF